MFTPVRDVIAESRHHLFSETELGSGVCYIEKGDQHSLQLFEMNYMPDAKVDVHAHEEDEIIYVLDGELWVGNRCLTKGSTVFVQHDTLYSFRAGPKGMRMLNFRPRGDSTYITVDEFQERRAASKAQAK